MFRLGLLSPSVQMGGGHGGTVPGLGSLLYCTLWFLRWWRSTWLLREWPTETFWPMHHLLQVFGELIWTRCCSHYVLWTRPFCFEGKKDWRECEYVDLDYVLRAEESPVLFNTQHRHSHCTWRHKAGPVLVLWIQRSSENPALRL